MVATIPRTQNTATFNASELKDISLQGRVRRERRIDWREPRSSAPRGIQKNWPWLPSATPTPLPFRTLRRHAGSTKCRVWCRIHGTPPSIVLSIKYREGHASFSMLLDWQSYLAVSCIFGGSRPPARRIQSRASSAQPPQRA